MQWKCEDISVTLLCLFFFFFHNWRLNHQQNRPSQVQTKPISHASWVPVTPRYELPGKVFCQLAHNRALAGCAHMGKLACLVHYWSPVCSDIELWRSLIIFYGILELCCRLIHRNSGICPLKCGISAVFCHPEVYSCPVEQKVFPSFAVIFSPLFLL